MAITIDTQILNQEAESVGTYCYLYEPMRIVITESDLTAKKLYIDLEILDISDDTIIVENLIQYGDYDINPGNSLSIDLMKLVQQHHNANIFNFSHIDDIVDDVIGWKAVVSEYKYNFKIYSDITFTPESIIKLPIIGGRFFKDFNPQIIQSQQLTEAAIVGIDLNNKWIDYPFIINTLADPTLQDARPSIDKVISSSGKHPCGGYLIWKSRLGGWMSWGFDIKTEDSNFQYQGTLQTDMFESTKEIGGSPYIETDYTSMSFGNSMTLKALSLTNEELEAVRGIKTSPAIYYMKSSSGELELMRLSSATVPISSLSNGGNVTVSLKSISTTSFNTK